MGFFLLLNIWKVLLIWNISTFCDYIMFRYIFLAYNLNKLTHRVALTISSESFLPNHLFLTLSKLLKLVQSLTFHNVLLSFEEILNGNIQQQEFSKNRKNARKQKKNTEKSSKISKIVSKNQSTHLLCRKCWQKSAHSTTNINSTYTHTFDLVENSTLCCGSCYFGFVSFHPNFRDL